MTAHREVPLAIDRHREVVTSSACERTVMPLSGRWQQRCCCRVSPDPHPLSASPVAPTRLAFDPTGCGTCRHGEVAGMGSGATGTAGHALVDAYGFSLREPGLDVGDVAEGDCG